MHTHTHTHTHTRAHSTHAGNALARTRIAYIQCHVACSLASHGGRVLTLPGLAALQRLTLFIQTSKFGLLYIRKTAQTRGRFNNGPQWRSQFVTPSQSRTIIGK